MKVTSRVLKFGGVLAMAGAIVSMSSTPAEAALKLFITDGTIVGTVTELGAGGSVSYSCDPVPATPTITPCPFADWNLVVTSGVSKPIIGSPGAPEMDLVFLAHSTAAGTIDIFLTDTDFTLDNAIYTGAIGGTDGSGSITAKAYRSDANLEFGVGAPGLLFTLGPFSGGSFSGGGSSGVINTGDTLNSLTQHVRITHTGSATSSGNYSLVGAAVPEPASMILLGSGLLGLAAKARRRKNQK